VSALEEQAGGFGHDFAVTFLQDVQEERVAGGAAEGRAGFQGMAYAGGGEGRKESGEVGGRMREERGEGEGAFGERGFAALEDFVAYAEEVDGMRGIAALMVVGRFLEQVEDTLQFVGRAFEFFEAFEQGFGGGGLVLGLARFFERVDNVEVG
jgi:hypothetical protein